MLDSDARALAQALAATARPLASATVRRGTEPPPARLLRGVLESCKFYDDGLVERFRKSCPKVRSCKDLRALIARQGGPRGFLLQTLGLRDARRAGVLAEAVEYIIDVQRRFRGATEVQRLRKWARSMRPGDYASVGINGFGLEGFQRLRGLFGANAARPDRRTTRYIAFVLHRPIGELHGLYLLERAGEIGGIDVTDLEARIP